MADPDRTTAHDLIESLLREPYRLDFFQALRLIECLHADKPRLGTSLRASDDPIRLGNDPELDFAPAALSSYRPGKAGRPDRLGVRFFGLFGPNGPLPLHLTEYARERIHHHNDHTFTRFADIFHHRMLCLYYRAWANTEPTVHYDRPESDRFAGYVASLFGTGAPALQGRDAMPDRAKLFFAGLLSCQARHADGLNALIEEFFQLPTQVREFVGEWLAIPGEDQTRLGLSSRTGALGVSSVLGGKVWGCQHKFRIVLGPLTLAEYRAMLPAGASLVELLAVVRNYIGDELAWDVNLILRLDEVPALRLDGNAQLGWTTWVGNKTDGDADELMLDPFFRAATAVQ